MAHLKQTYYIYDGSGQRVRKITEREAKTGDVPTKKSERIYAGGIEVYREYDTTFDVTLERQTYHVMDDKSRIAMIDTPTKTPDSFLSRLTGSTEQRLVRYQFGNHLGSASIETDEDANVISYEEYHPYGTTSYQAMDKDIKAAVKRYRYTGMERDEESGLEYHSARYYLPWLGRWTAADPEGLVDGPNQYSYVKDNPIELIDMSGKKAGNPGKEKGIVEIYGVLYQRFQAEKGTWVSASLKKMGYDQAYGKDTAYGAYVGVAKGTDLKPLATPDRIKPGQEYLIPVPIIQMDPLEVEGKIPPKEITDPTLPSASDKPSQIGFGVKNPIISSRIGWYQKGTTNISTNAVRFATRIGLDNKSNKDGMGTEVNAFRHALWQATITKEFGKDIAQNVGYAHEDSLPKDLSKRNFTGPTALIEADTSADLLNNVLGRQIGKDNPNATMQELAIKALELFHNEGLYVAATNPDGSVTISRTKLSDTKYKAALAVLRTLNEKGFTAPEQKQIDDIKRQAQELNNRGPKF